MNIDKKDNPSETIRKNKAIKYYKLAMSIAEIFSKDPRTKVGAIILVPDTLQVLSLGYNGMPRCVEESTSERWERPQKYMYVEHAERNAIYNAAFAGTSLRNSICVVTMFPCADCARALIQSGIKVVVSKKMEKPRWESHWEVSTEMFTEAGVQIIYIKDDDLIV